MLRGPGHLGGEGYDFHRIVKAKKTTPTATTPTPFCIHYRRKNLPEGVSEEMLLEDIRAATGIRVRAGERRARGPAAAAAAAAAASSTEGFAQAQLEEHERARIRALGYSGPDTDELDRRLEDDRAQAEEDRRLLQDLNSLEEERPALAPEEVRDDDEALAGAFPAPDLPNNILHLDMDKILSQPP